MRRLLAVIVILLWAVPTFAADAPATRPIVWQPWTSDIFQQAKRENKFVLLNLGTSWCHWCHVMEGTTYADPQVIGLIGQKYIPVLVDADSRPDLANRYEDYGWPATIVFNADGGEIVKRRGYLEPSEMVSMLQAIIADPTPGPSVTAEADVHFTNSAALSADLRQKLLNRYLDSYDSDKGSWGLGQKFLDWNGAEWAMRLAAAGDLQADHMARQTLDAQLNLLDPAWGGVYQYSTDDDWQHPHFEKIMQMQAANLRIYSLAFAQYHKPEYLHAARAIHAYLTNFLLASNGAFYTSQDADLVDGVHSADYFGLSDAQRRAQGIPRIDQHQYARENGWAIAALAIYYQMTGDADALEQAKTAAKWIMQNRGISGGGFRHDESDSGPIYLGDTLAMGQAYLQLYIATADRDWLARAQAAADFISGHFVSNDSPGIVTSIGQSDSPFTPGPEFDENVEAARWANLLAQYSGKQTDRDLATTAMKYLATPQIALGHGILVAGVLLADEENSSPALHVVIVGSKSDAGAAAMYRLALAEPTAYKRVEWFDPAEGALPNADVEYPQLGKAAAFVCNGSACSSPAFTTDQLAQRIARAMHANH
jgi:uncharacterized protein YyaL (SSP411 family)